MKPQTHTPVPAPDCGRPALVEEMEEVLELRGRNIFYREEIML